ncbi:MAG: hypothetical protein ACR2HP_09905 [Ilumatobacteraceae bacterium]
MSLISDLTPRWTESPRPSATPTLCVGQGRVVALRHRPVLVTGALGERTELDGDRLVAARDIAGRPCWIPAAAVWSDADQPVPEHPRPVGLATARTRDGVLLTGISDRLGWEALQAWEGGQDLPVVAGVLDSDADDLSVVDGRLGHEVPTVLILGQGTARWGAGSTWANAVHRALYGDDGRIGGTAELDSVANMLGCAGLAVVTVDLATPLIASAGVVRCSVQLAANDGLGRRWDA